MPIELAWYGGEQHVRQLAWHTDHLRRQLQVIFNLHKEHDIGKIFKKFASMTREERLNLAATNLVRQGLNAERGDALLELGDVPDLCWPSNSAEVGFFPSFVVPFLVAALNAQGMPFFGSDLPDVLLMIEDPDYFAVLIQDMVGAYGSTQSVRAVLCPKWQRMADRGESTTIPLSAGIRAFVETNWLMRTGACAVFALRFLQILDGVQLLAPATVRPPKATVKELKSLGRSHHIDETTAAHTCALCFYRIEDAGVVCSGCKIVGRDIYYCSEEHQRLHWTMEHRQTCSKSLQETLDIISASSPFIEGTPAANTPDAIAATKARKNRKKKERKKRSAEAAGAEGGTADGGEDGEKVIDQAEELAKGVEGLKVDELD